MNYYVVPWRLNNVIGSGNRRLSTTNDTDNPRSYTNYNDMFIDTVTLDIPGNVNQIHTDFVANETRFGWGGPYVNFKRSSPRSTGPRTPGATNTSSSPRPASSSPPTPLRPPSVEFDQPAPPSSKSTETPTRHRQPRWRLRPPHMDFASAPTASRATAAALRPTPMTPASMATTMISSSPSMASTVRPLDEIQTAEDRSTSHPRSRFKLIDLYLRQD
jgi:hypothetical protein